MRGTAEPYHYEREVEDFLRWSPNVRNPAVRRKHRLTPAELLELRRLHSGYAARTGAPGTDSPTRQAETMAHAARAMESDDLRANGGSQSEATESAERGGGPEPGERADPAERAEQPADAADPPLEHYDDLSPDEVVGLLHSLETRDLLALRDHERGRQGRPRVLAAIDGVLVRRESPQSR
jgi:hypothetical protein